MFGVPVVLLLRFMPSWFYRENLLGSSESLLESDKTAAEKLHKQATSSSFGSDDESSNDDQVCGMYTNYGNQLCVSVENSPTILDCDFVHVYGEGCCEGGDFHGLRWIH